MDTNSITQIAQTATAVQTSFNWPAIAAAALWVRGDIKNVSEYCRSQGGILWMIATMFYNPAALVKPPGATAPSAQNPNTKPNRTNGSDATNT